MSMKEVSSDYLRSRGLSESEILVYSTVLGLGNATIGEINLAIKMELPEIYLQIKQLQEIGYIKQIPGKVPRYIAMEPFLKDYAQLTSEMKLGLINIRDNFQKQVEEFNTSIKTIVPQLNDFAEVEKRTKLEALTKRVDKLIASIDQILDNSYQQFKHLAESMSAWPSECIEATLPQFDDALENSKDKFVTSISKYADSLVIDSREIRDKLEKATIHHKILVAERLEKLKSDIDDALIKLRDDIVKQNFATSSTYGANLDEKDISARESAAQTINDLIRNVVILAREKDGDISSETSQMINNALGPLFRSFDFLQGEVKTTLEELLETHSEETAKFSRHVKSLVESSIPDVLETVTNHLEESRDESAQFIDQKITDPFKELEKMKGDISQDITVFKKDLQEEAYKQDQKAKASLIDRISKVDERIELSKFEARDIIGLSNIDFEDLIQSLIKNIMNENAEKINQVTTIMKEAGTKLENSLGNTIFLLENTGKTFDGIVNMSEKVMPMDELEISLIYGNESIVRAMKDMLLRAKEEFIVISPTVLTDFLYEIEKQPQMTNYQIISKIEEEDVSLLNSLIKRGNVITKNYREMDYWIAIRDNEEIIYAPKIHAEKNLGFVTTHPRFYKLFYKLTNENVFSKLKAKEIE